MSSIKFFILELNLQRSESCLRTLSKSAGEIGVERSSLWLWALKLNPVQFSVLSSFEPSAGSDCLLIVNYALFILKKFMFLLQNHLHELQLTIFWQSSSKIFQNLMFEHETVAVVPLEPSYHALMVLRIIQNPSFLMKIRKSLNGLSAQRHPLERSSCSWAVLLILGCFNDGSWFIQVQMNMGFYYYDYNLDSFLSRVFFVKMWWFSSFYHYLWDQSVRLHLIFHEKHFINVWSCK